ncbi:MAG: SIMPL domain-containing protein [Methanobacteriota archaeon]
MKTINMMALLMGCLVFVGTLAGTFYITKPSIAQASDITNVIEEEPGQITVTGSAVVTTEPNQVAIMLEIQALHLKAATAKNQVSTLLNKVLTALRNLGLNNKDIQTTGYRIQPEYEYNYNTRTFVGYRVICSLKITVKNLDKAGTVIDTSVDAGSLVTSITFELSIEKQEELKLQALQEAAVDAKEKAEVVASALGYTVDRVKTISVNAQYRPNVYWKAASVAYDSADTYVPPTEILPGDASVSASVTVVFDIR